MAAWRRLNARRPLGAEVAAARLATARALAARRAGRLSTDGADSGAGLCGGARLAGRADGLRRASLALPGVLHGAGRLPLRSADGPYHLSYWIAMIGDLVRPCTSSGNTAVLYRPPRRRRRRQHRLCPMPGPPARRRQSPIVGVHEPSVPGLDQRHPPELLDDIGRAVLRVEVAVHRVDVDGDAAELAERAEVGARPDLARRSRGWPPTRRCPRPAAGRRHRRRTTGSRAPTRRRPCR